MTSVTLPIDAILPELVAALGSTPSIVVRAPTGAGKTTRVPPAIVDAGLAGDGRVIVLEPRRIAARAAARRMAFERGTELGGEVGYHVRFDRRASARTRILVVTEGVLVRMLQDDPLLDGVGAVVFDEFHERNLDSDLALAMVRKLQHEVRPELKIAVLSATLPAEHLARWLEPATVLESEGRLYPIEIRYSAAPTSRSAPVSRSGPTSRSVSPSRSASTSSSLARRVADGVRDAFGATTGGVLAFLPGVGEIRRTRDELADFARTRGALLCELYGDLPPDAQDAALLAGDRRKIVLATNVAETSVTVEGVTAVVDSGHARVLRFDPSVGLDRLELARISRASADQRAGRAGRTQPGLCLRLWSEAEHRTLAAHDEPEIRRVDLARAMLVLWSAGETDVKRFPWFEAPPSASVDRAVELLELVGAVDRGRLTPRGRALADLPAHPRIGGLILAGAELGCPERAALAAALLMERDPFRRAAGPDKRAIATSDSDVLDRVLAMEAFEDRASHRGATLEPHPGAARSVLESRDALLGDLDRIGRARRRGGRERRGSHDRARSDDAAAPRQPDHKSSRPSQRGATASTQARDPDAAPSRETEHDLARAILAAYPDRVARRREPGSPRGVMVGGRGVRLADESSVRDAELFVCVEIDAGARGERAEALVRQASAIEAEWLASDALATRVITTFDERTQRVSAVRRTMYLDLVLEEAQVPPDPTEAANALAAAAAQDLPRALALERPEVVAFLDRVRSLAQWMPELGLPRFDDSELGPLLPELCAGARSFAELAERPLVDFLKARMDRRALSALEREAPERIQVPSGSLIRLVYEPGRPPVLAVRIQEIFGLAQTPRVAAGRVPVLLHLLAPNYRPEQVTDDLASFWSTVYPRVRTELRRRYPRHAWPEDPWNAAPERRPKKRTR